MDNFLGLFYLEHYDDILDVDLQMLQDWLGVSPSSKFYTIPTVLFHKDEGSKDAVKNCMSHFSMFVPTQATVKLFNVYMGHAKRIAIILCSIPNPPIIYPMVPIYYFPGHPCNTISSGAIKFYVGFQNFRSELIEHCDFVYPHVCSWISPYQTQKLDFLQKEIFKMNLQINR